MDYQRRWGIETYPWLVKRDRSDGFGHIATTEICFYNLSSSSETGWPHAQRGTFSTCRLHGLFRDVALGFAYPQLDPYQGVKAHAKPEEPVWRFRA